MAGKIAASYRSLLGKVRQTLILGRQRIEAEKIKTYWQTGKLIQADILKNKEIGGRVTEPKLGTPHK